PHRPRPRLWHHNHLSGVSGVIIVLDGNSTDAPETDVNGAFSLPAYAGTDLDIVFVPPVIDQLAEIAETGLTIADCEAYLLNVVMPCATQTLCLDLSLDCPADPIAGVDVVLKDASGSEVGMLVSTDTIGNACSVIYDPIVNPAGSSSVPLELVTAVFSIDECDYEREVWLGCGVTLACLDVCECEGDCITSFAGTVLNSAGAPIENVSVSVGGQTGSTDANGNYFFPSDMPVVSTAVLFTPPTDSGYAPFDTIVEFGESMCTVSLLDVILDCDITPAVCLTFTDECGMLVSGIDVTATATPGEPFTGSTGGNGFVCFSYGDLHDSDVTLSWDNSGYNECGCLVTPLFCGIQEFDIDLTCRERGLHVNVSLADPYLSLNPVENAVVTWTDVADSGNSGSATTNFEGLASTWTALPAPGVMYNIEVDIPVDFGMFDTYTIPNGPFQLMCCELQEHAVVVPCGGQEVCVIIGPLCEDTTGFYTGVDVYYYQPCTGELLGTSVTGDSFATTGCLTLPDGDASVLNTIGISYFDDGQPYDAIVPILCGRTEQCFEECVRILSGTVTDSDSGLGIAGVMVTVEGTGLVGFTDAAGFYMIEGLDEDNLLPGYTITFSKAGYTTVMVTDVLMPECAIVVEDVSLTPTGTPACDCEISLEDGLLLDQADNSELCGYRVGLCITGPDGDGNYDVLVELYLDEKDNRCGLSHFTVASSVDGAITNPYGCADNDPLTGNNNDVVYLTDLMEYPPLGPFDTGFKMDAETGCIDDFEPDGGTEYVMFQTDQLIDLIIIAKTGAGHESIKVTMDKLGNGTLNCDIVPTNNNNA
ncbi:hypothetical protein KIPB_005037, partial [Kipferlia bialata]